MSQHDFSIANQTASSARADINSGLQALASNSSGSSAPSTTYANQWWYDSTNDILKIRNEADTAWINVATINQGSSRYEPYNAVPAGAVNTFAMSTAPTGWLSCGGTVISRTTYSGLFSVVGTVYGAGDGSTTFKLPDLRGEFVRGFDASRGVDTGRVFGSAQDDEIESHEHRVFKANVTGTSDIGVNNDYLGYRYNDFGTTLVADSGRSGPMYSGGGTETRPRNIALLYCIKY